MSAKGGTENQNSPEKRQKRPDREVAGYPDKPIRLWLVVLAAAAWGLWMVFLIVMAYIRHVEWPR